MLSQTVQTPLGLLLPDELQPSPAHAECRQGKMSPHWQGMNSWWSRTLGVLLGQQEVLAQLEVGQRSVLGVVQHFLIPGWSGESGAVSCSLKPWKRLEQAVLARNALQELSEGWTPSPCHNSTKLRSWHPGSLCSTTLLS